MRSIVGVWVGMAVVNTPVWTAYRSTLVDTGSQLWHVCLPVSIETARQIFTAFFVCDYLLPLAVIGFISLSIYRHIIRHGITSTVGHHSDRSVSAGDLVLESRSQDVSRLESRSRDVLRRESRSRDVPRRTIAVDLFCNSKVKLRLYDRPSG